MGRYRSKQMKRARPGQHAEATEATSTIFRTACQSMVEQDVADYPSRPFSVSMQRKTLL